MRFNFLHMDELETITLLLVVLAFFTHMTDVRQRLAGQPDMETVPMCPLIVLINDSDN